MDIELNWSGPFSFIPSQDCQCIFGDDSAKTPGLYLWTISYEDGYLINYIGISASNVAQRQREHLDLYLCGKYRLYDPKKFVAGKKVVVYQPEEGFESFLSRYKELSTTLLQQLQVYRLFVAALDADKPLLEKIETSLITVLRDAGGLTAEFLGNIRPSRIPQENDRQLISWKSRHRFVGLPSNIFA